MPAPVAPTQTFEVNRSALVSELIAHRLGVELPGAHRLIEFGAVYWNKKRLQQDVTVSAHDWLRVHPAPRRFLHQVDWETRLVANEDHYLVVDKPQGLPVHPTCDNAIENVKALLVDYLGYPVFPAHRLDIGTSGLMVLAKNAEFLSMFQNWLREGLVDKMYLAKVVVPPPMGRMIHYMSPAPRGAKQLSVQPTEGWKRCELEVVDVTPQGDGFDVMIKLITGRQHQIRAQLSTVGSPIIGDDLYGGRHRESQIEAWDLRSCSIEFPGHSYKLDYAAT